MPWFDLLMLLSLLLLAWAGKRRLSNLPPGGRPPQRPEKGGSAARAAHRPTRTSSPSPYSPPPPPPPRPPPRPSAAPAGAGSAASDIEVSEIDGEVRSDVTAVLECALISDPRRVDLYLKLLQLHHAAARAQDFRRVAEAYALHVPRAPWEPVARMGRELSPGLALYQPRAPAAPAPAPQGHRRHYEEERLAGLETRLLELRRGYASLRHDASFLQTLSEAFGSEIGRPTPLYYAAALSTKLGGAQIYFKREDMSPAGAEQRVNALGQALIARYNGKRRLVCGSVGGRAAMAFASAAHSLGLQATLFVSPPVAAARERELAAHAARQGAELIVLRGPGSGSDPRSLALGDWLQHSNDAFYVSGLQAGPDPYPMIVQDLQSVIGQEVLRQLIKRRQAPEDTMLVGSLHSALAALGFCQPWLDRGGVRIELVNPGAGDGGSLLPWARERRVLAADGRVSFVDVDDAAGAEAARLCEEQEHLFLKPHNARALAQGLQLARAGNRRQAIVVLLGAAA